MNNNFFSLAQCVCARMKTITIYNDPFDLCGGQLSRLARQSLLAPIGFTGAKLCIINEIAPQDRARPTDAKRRPNGPLCPWAPGYGPSVGPIWAPQCPPPPPLPMGQKTKPPAQPPIVTLSRWRAAPPLFRMSVGAQFCPAHRARRPPAPELKISELKN